MVWPLLRLLRTGGPVQVAAYLRHELDEHFGGSLQEDPRAVAERLLRWWAESATPRRSCSTVARCAAVPGHRVGWECPRGDLNT